MKHDIARNKSIDLRNDIIFCAGELVRALDNEGLLAPGAQNRYDMLKAKLKEYADFQQSRRMFKL